jgi:cytochrome P450 family 4
MHLGVELLFNPLSKIGLMKFMRSYYEMMKKLQFINNFTMDIIKKRRQKLKNNEEKLDEVIFLNQIFKNIFEGDDLSDEQILGEMNTNIMSLHDSVKSATSFVHYCLAKYPEMQEKVFEEVSQLGGEISETDLDEMKFTHAFIKEALRMYAPVSFYTRKLSLEVTAGGFTFPKDTEVMFSPFLMGRNVKYFSDPLKFDPNRFLELKSDPPGFIPFGLAPRKCLGVKVAYIILKISIIGVLKNYKLTLPKESEELELNIDLTLSAKNGIKLNFEPRI